MSNTSGIPYPVQPGYPLPEVAPASEPPAGRTALVSLAVLLGSALVGLAGGFAWAALAPRPLYVVVSRGSADVVNPETKAFITADFWYCVIAVAGGVIIGLAGYLLAVRRHGPMAMGAVLLGSLAAAIGARWIGQNSGLAQFDHQLLTSPPGATLHAPLVLGADTSAILWPAIAFWPLAACLVAGGILAIRMAHERSATRPYGLPSYSARQFESFPGQ